MASSITYGYLFDIPFVSSRRRLFYCFPCLFMALGDSILTFVSKYTIITLLALNHGLQVKFGNKKDLFDTNTKKEMCTFVQSHCLNCFQKTMQFKLCKTTTVMDILGGSCVWAKDCFFGGNS